MASTSPSTKLILHWFPYGALGSQPFFPLQRVPAIIVCLAVGPVHVASYVYAHRAQCLSAAVVAGAAGVALHWSPYGALDGGKRDADGHQSRNDHITSLCG